jgi:hypothetical protein
MKIGFIPLLLIFLVLAAVAYMAWMVLRPERRTLRVRVPESYLTITDTSRFSLYPIEVPRKQLDDSVLVIFPKSVRNSAVYLYDSLNYQRLLANDKRARPMLQTAGLAERVGSPTLNLSRQKAGSYYAHLTSCSYGGFFEIQLAAPLQQR